MNISEQIINKILTYRPLTRQEMIDMTEGANHIMKHHYLRILSGYELKLLNLLKVDSSCWYSGWNLLFFLAKGTLESKLQGGHIRPIKTFDLDTPAGIISHPSNMAYLSPNIDYIYEDYHYKWNREAYENLTPLGKIFWHKINKEIRLKSIEFTHKYNNLGGSDYAPPEDHMKEIADSERIIKLLSSDKEVHKLLPLLDDKSTILSSEYLGTTKPKWLNKVVSDKLLCTWRNKRLNERWMNKNKSKTSNQGSFTSAREGYRYEVAAAKADYSCIICGIDSGLKNCHEHGYDRWKDDTPLGIVNHPENVSLLCRNHDKELEVGDKEFMKLFRKKKQESLEKNPPKKLKQEHSFWDTKGGECMDYDFKKLMKKYLK
tara:strand:- start:931 stop:2052 length:1122 start_codon:yes stop_codon:yes gene_type:complete